MPTAETSRRNFLALSGAAIAASVVPFTAATTPIATVAKPLLPAWVVGSDDNWNYRVIRAATEHDARVRWMSAEEGTDGKCEEDRPFNEECDCDECRLYFSADATRHPEWDDKSVKIGDQHWHAAGLGSHCARCSEEAFDHDGAKFVANSVVCCECLTLADWDIVDPERAAEMRADLEDAA